jgi:hypothetical protein
MTVGETSFIWLICPCSQAVLYVSLSSNCRHFRGVDRMQPIEPFLHMLNLRGAFLAVPGCGAVRRIGCEYRWSLNTIA